MRLSVQLAPTQDAPAPVEYVWDPDTEILSARFRDPAAARGMSGSLGLEGSDGSWLIFDVKGGRIHAVEVAVWPDMRPCSSINPPANVEHLAVTVPSRPSQPDVASVQVAAA